MEKIIIIDDDEMLCEKLVEYFKQFSFELASFHHPNQGISALKSEEYKVLILDGMLPDKDGLEVCKEIRSFSNIPIIFLTGRVEETDKVLGLESGANDYVTKPFSARELVARVKSQIRSNQMIKDYSESKSNNITAGSLSLNLGNYTTTINEKSVSLTATEFEILKFLVENKGNVKSREEIMQGLYGDSWEAFDRSLDIAISRIRKKLSEHSPDQEFIKTIRLKGYMFVDSN